MALIDNIHWLGHASFFINAHVKIFIDPYKLSTDEKADIILISHEHFDHCSVADVKHITQPSTVIITVPGNQSKLAAVADNVADIKLVRPGDKLSVENVGLEVVPAYNTNKSFHSKSNEWVGFIVRIGNESLYFAGDTDFIPEMKSIHCDIALLPVSGTYVMTPEEAASAANLINPKIAVPMHYCGIIGTSNDAEKFKSLCKCEVRILEKE